MEDILSQITFKNNPGRGGTCRTRFPTFHGGTGRGIREELTQIPFTICDRHCPLPVPRPHRPAPAEATSACLQPPAPRPGPAPPLLPTAGPFCTMCNPQHSLLRRCPHSASGPEQQRLRLCRAPLDTSRTPNWSFSSPPLLSRHVQACALSTPKQSMPNELPVRGRRGRRGLGPPPCLLMLPQAPQPSARAFCRGRRTPLSTSTFFFFSF